MSWESIDWLDFELNEYQESLRLRVREAYVAAYTVLEKAHKKGVDELSQDLEKATGSEDFDFIPQAIQFEELRWEQQTEALAAMALALLASLTEAFLDEQKGRQLDKTYPPAAEGYKGKSELLRNVSEYKERFKIDLEAVEMFETVREVVLARNCCLHNGCTPNDDYLRQTKQRLVREKGGNIGTEPKQLDLLIKELSEFSDALNKKMRELRLTANAAEKPALEEGQA
jgi:hypothetical protein